MDNILKYLDEIEDVLEESKAVIFSGKTAVDKEKIFEIIDEIRLNMPNEIRESQRIITDRDKIIELATLEAKTIIKSSEEQAKKLVDEHEIYRQALDEGNKIIEDSKQNARDMRINAMDYADEILAKTEEIIREALDNVTKQNNATETFFNKTIDVLYNNRMELRGVKGNK